MVRYVSRKGSQAVRLRRVDRVGAVAPAQPLRPRGSLSRILDQALDTVAHVLVRARDGNDPAVLARMISAAGECPCSPLPS